MDRIENAWIEKPYNSVGKTAILVEFHVGGICNNIQDKFEDASRFARVINKGKMSELAFLHLLHTAWIQRG